MHTVQSKYKNPDKLIAKISRELKEMTRSRDFFKGEWKAGLGGTEISFGIWGSIPGGLHVQDTVTLIGHIQEIREYVEDNKRAVDYKIILNGLHRRER